MVHKISYSCRVIPKNYQQVLALAFAIHEITEKAELLPNVTLGYKVHDNYFDSWRATNNTLDFLFRVKGNPLNYNCEKTEQVLAVIGGLTSQNSMQIAHILSTYNIPQVSYGSFEEALSDNIQFPFLYRMTPNEEPQYVGIVSLLQYFGWNWVGLIVPDDDNGETFLRTLTPKLFESHICIAWTMMIPRLHSFLKTLHFNNNAGEEIFLDEKGELAAGFDIINFFIFPNGSSQKVRVGHMDPLALEDAGQCEKCPADHYPNKNKNWCIGKKLSYLSYGELLGALLVSFTLFLSGNTVVLMGIFLIYRHTPIVKANNWRITCALLSSLLLCFLCSFLFIGWPGKVTCLLRQMVFGIIFSVSIACVLAKTLTVIWAFMATKPGSQMRSWLGNRLALSVIIFPSLIQTTICIVWLAISPPFPESDMHSQSDTITLQCNQGSDLMFYLVLGFMWLLAIISFTVAFFARKLPDSFNEAKLITFSMLVFCSIWASFVPAYLGTKGKYTVAVEVFSILTSSGGLLCCFFFPKCYIMILRPELNTRDQLVRKRSGGNLGFRNTNL
ncbi:vomeronasal type-2 receptor 26-like [Pogona vitticeps]